MKIAVFTDADNTLWETDGVFAAAQTWLLSEVITEMGVTALGDEPLALLRKYDQAIAAQHHAGLRYPPRLLVQALALGLQGVPPEQAAKRAWAGKSEVLAESKVIELEMAFLRRLEVLPELRSGVREGLELLSGLSLKPTILTEGHKSRCEAYLDSYDLVSHHFLPMAL